MEGNIILKDKCSTKSENYVNIIVKNILNWVEPINNRNDCISCDMKLPNEPTILPTVTSQLTTKKNCRTKEILSSTKLPTHTDQLITKNTDKSKEILSYTNLLTHTDQLITMNIDTTKKNPSSTNLPKDTDQLTIKNTDRTYQ